MPLAVPISLVAIAVSMSLLSVAFLNHRMAFARDLIASFWALRRQQVLHLRCLNGFDFLRERLHDWSLAPLLLAAASIIPWWSSAEIRSAGVAIAGGFTLRYALRFFTTRSRMKLATLPLRYDGFGSYARAATDWRRESQIVGRKALCAASILCLYALM